MFLPVGDVGGLLDNPVFVPAQPAVSPRLTDAEFGAVQRAIDGYIEALRESGLRLHVQRDFQAYVAVRRAHGDHHLNQAFDPRHARIGHRDFWLRLDDGDGDTVATFCMRVCEVEDFYAVIRTQSLWFGIRPTLVDPRYVVSCVIPPFGGVVGHGGGLWIRPDRRGQRGLVQLLPRLARALALRNHDIDHDSAMLLNSAEPAASEKVRRRAAAAARTYGFARAEPFVQGWFPPEQRDATMHLCHATRQEAIDSLGEPAPLQLAA
jgi:hypothetical protein